VMDSPAAAAETAPGAAEFGVKIYLDDFGTGISSLSPPAQAASGTLKIDRSFVKSSRFPSPGDCREHPGAGSHAQHSVGRRRNETEVQARELEPPRVYFTPRLPFLAVRFDPFGRGNPGRQQTARPEASPAIDPSRRDLNAA